MVENRATVVSHPTSPNSLSAQVNFRESGIVAFMVLAVAFFACTSPQFLSDATLTSVLSASAIEMVVAAGMAGVVIARQIDLSVGAIMGISAYSVGWAMDRGLHPLVAVALAVTLGTLLGAFNGLLVTRAKVPAMIATLGTASIYRGLLYLLSPKILGFMINASQIPAGFRGMSGIRVLGLPIITVIALLAAVCFGVLLSRTVWGRNLYAIGSNPEAARFAGIRPDRDVFVALTLVGSAAGLGGFLHVMRFASVNVQTGMGLEFNVIAAVVVGGISIAGGSGGIPGAILGVLLLNTLSRGFILMNIPEYWKVVATGVAIVVAVFLDGLLARSRENRLRWSRRPHLVTTLGGDDHDR